MVLSQGGAARVSAGESVRKGSGASERAGAKDASGATDETLRTRPRARGLRASRESTSVWRAPWAMHDGLSAQGRRSCGLE